MSEDNLLQELDQAFVSPDKYFKDQKLAPYTEGSRLLMVQIRNENDSPIFFVYAFIYLHILLAKNRKEAIRLAWDQDTFRERVMEWSEKLAEEDRDVACLLVAKTLNEANKAKVNVIPSGVPQPPGNG
ncbi:MAG: hypothetical protein EBR82_43160 [Caulobacteraceae bacterium]|nr:hypothetical protein [Caulobacteraceae bacterium]